MNLTALSPIWPQVLKAKLDELEVSYTEFADGIGVRRETVSRWWCAPAVANPAKKTIDAILGFLSARLGRPVSYEEVFDSDQLERAS